MSPFRSDAREPQRRAVARRGAVLLIAALLAGTGLPAASGLANPQSGVVLAESGPWTSSDYVEAIFAVHNGGITLPRRGNPKTEALFERLVDRSNIEILMASPLAPEEKSRNILIILSATGEFRGRYGYAVALGDDVQNELVEIQIFRLYLIDYLATLDMADRAGMKRSTSAIATTILGTLDTLAEAPVFTRDQLVALVTALAEHYPAIRARLGPDERRAITTRLQAMALAESDPLLKSSLAEVLAEARRGN